MKNLAVNLSFVALVLLSISTGVTKLIHLPVEMALFRAAGFSDLLTVIFGIVQVGGGLALIVPKTRRTGAGIMVASFCIAAWVVWLSGSPGFFALSLLFIVLAALPFWPSYTRQIIIPS